MSEKKTGLALLREPFPSNQISKLPKPTKKQTEEVKADYRKGIRCTICGTWHHPDVVHLDYVGHAALTDRLLNTDPNWTWEPMALGQDGYPVIDRDGGMWIKLTVCGVTRLGYGDAQGKTGGDAMKERIGDALRNAAMRFGAALDLWHKGDLHAHDHDEQEAVPPPCQEPAKPATKPATKPKAGLSDEELDAACMAIQDCPDLDTLKGIFTGVFKRANAEQQLVLAAAKDARKEQLTTKEPA
jgi:hypothetical protein